VGRLEAPALLHQTHPPPHPPNLLLLLLLASLTLRGKEPRNARNLNASC